MLSTFLLKLKLKFSDYGGFCHLFDAVPVQNGLKRSAL